MTDLTKFGFYDVTNTEEMAGNFNLRVRARLEHAGKFCSSGNLLAVYDAKGRVYLGRDTQENRSILEKNGYKNETVYIPFLQFHQDERILKIL